MNKEEEVVPMCEALRQLEADAAARAVAEMSEDLMRNLHLTAEQALAALEIFGPERETLIRKLQ